MGKQSKKQEVTNRKLDFGNIGKAQKDKNLQRKENPKKDNLVPIKFKVHKNVIENFHVLRLAYAEKHKKFSLSNNEMFKLLVSFMTSVYDENNSLEQCPDDFKNAVIKPGKRKATERTYPGDLTDSIIFTIPEYVADDYMNLMFTFIRKNDKDSVFNDHHTRTYFFYDFMDFMSSNKQKLLNYKYE